MREIGFGRSLDEHGVEADAGDRKPPHRLAVTRRAPVQTRPGRKRGAGRHRPRVQLTAELPLSEVRFERGDGVLPPPDDEHPHEREQAEHDERGRDPPSTRAPWGGRNGRPTRAPCINYATHYLSSRLLQG